MKAIYVAGPYTAPNAWEREQNIREAEAVSLAVIKSGFAPICVHSMARFWYGIVSEAEAIFADIEIMKRCDGVVLCHHWQSSAGTINEIREAKSMGIPVYRCVAALRDQEPSPHDELLAEEQL